MFKKGSIAKKKSEQNDTRPPSSLTEEETHLNQGEDIGKSPPLSTIYLPYDYLDLRLR